MTLFRVFAPFAFGYFLSYLFRVVNSVIAPDLVDDLGLTASDLGLLTSTYFLTFAAFQLPLGVLLDRFGPRRTEAALLIAAAAGAVIFASAQSINSLILGRALIGFGVSACLMGAFKAFVMWFDRTRLPMINGFQMAAGGMGALMATAPVEAALQFTDWRGVFYILAALTAVAAVVIFFVVPEKDPDHGGASFAAQVRGIGEVFTSPAFWRVAPITVFTQAGFLSIQSLWLGPWLRDIGGLDRAGVAEHLFMIAASMIAGFVLMGTMTERLGRYGISTMTVAITGLSIFLIAQMVIVIQVPGWVLVPWLVFTFFGSAGILPYAALSQKFAANLAGRVNTGLNLLVFAFAFAGQWGIGIIIDRWPLTASGGYAPEAYQTGFGIFLALQVAALIWYFVYRRAQV